jgi:phospholipid/cholesterol/gamma-HCH transport system substrate-binding protein
MSSSRGRDIKVGLFVLAGLLLSGLVIFLIGDERRLFASSVEFHTKFNDVQGLKSGAPIRMGGIDIGHASFVGYGKDPRDTTIYVTLDVVKEEAGRLRTDCKAKIITKGLLGDKMIEITKGESAESVPPGGQITGEEPEDVMVRVNEMADKASGVIDNVKRATDGFADPQLHKDLKGSVASLNVVLSEVAHGDGYPNKFLTDKAEAERISRTLANLDQATAELTHTLRETRGIVSRVKAGPGFAHDVVYGDGPKKEIQQFGHAAEEVALTLKGVRDSDSLAHDMLYGGNGDGADAMRNVTAMTADLRSIVADMKAGKGTIGALLVDPSVYEDLKVVLGNVQRNDVLRALVRYSIKQDEKKPAVDVGAASRPPAAAAPATTVRATPP